MARGISVEQHNVVGKPTHYAQVDVTEPEGKVEVEIDTKRRVLYVHMEGYSVLRICRIEELRLIQDGEPIDWAYTEEELRRLRELKTAAPTDSGNNPKEERQ